MKLWLGPTQLLVSIKNPELIKEMLLKAKDKLPLTGKAYRLAFGRSTLFASSFDKVLTLQVYLLLLLFLNCEEDDQSLSKSIGPVLIFSEACLQRNVSFPWTMFGCCFYYLFFTDFFVIL